MLVYSQENMTSHNTDETFTPDPKNRAREIIRVIRSKLDPRWIATASGQIAERVLALPSLQNANTVGVYLATPREPQTAALIRQLFAMGKSLFVPAWNRGTAGYAMSEYAANEPIHQGHLGAYEPLHPRWATTYIDVMIVPLVAFDRNLNRLGHGGGHFDRLLSSHAGPKIGLAFELQRMEAVPLKPHDVPMNAVVTEQRVYDGRNPWADRINAPADMLQTAGT